MNKNIGYIMDKIVLTGVGLFSVDKKGNFVNEQEMNSDVALIMAQGLEQDGEEIDVRTIKSLTINGKKLPVFISPKGRLLIWTNSKSLVVDAIEFK